MSLSNDEKKHLRGLGHPLKPVVSVGNKGLNENVIAEIDRALADHELIKIKLAAGDRDARESIIKTICEKLKAEKVQTIGHILLLLRRTKNPNPKLSNLLR